MMIIEGKKLSQEVYRQLQARVSVLPFQPVFCDIVVGADPVSLSYVNIKGKTAERLGIKFMMRQLPADISQDELLREIAKLNQTVDLCGLIVQLPLPEHLNREAVLDAILPKLDVDCLGKFNAQAFYTDQADLLPPTAAAILYIIDTLNLNWQGKKFLILGRGDLVGKPVAHLLQQKKLEVASADRSTENLADLLKTADVIISGTGQPGLIKGEQIKRGCVIIDAGTAESNGGIVGDVDFNSAKDVAAYISPVPGGVGPLTVAKLLENVVAVAERSS